MMKTAIFALLVSIIAATFAISPAIGAPKIEGAILAAPAVVDPTLTPGHSFSIDITVHDVEGMLGYAFRLTYDPSILTATSFASYEPFTQAWPSGISGNHVDMAYTWPIPEYFGTTVFPRDAPLPVATITFMVNGFGISPLEFGMVIIAGVNGVSGVPVLDNGVFSNVWPAGTQAEDLYVGLNTALLEDRNFIVSKEPDQMQTLTAQLEHKGTLATTAWAKFRIVDSLGGLVAELTSTQVLLAPGEVARLTVDLDVSSLDMPASYTVEVQGWFIGFDYLTLSRHGAINAAKTTFVLTFKLEA